MRLTLAAIFLLLFVQHAAAGCSYSDDILKYKRKWVENGQFLIHTYWQTDACVPSGCYRIKDIVDNPKNYVVEDDDKVSAFARKCKFHKAGKDMKDSVKKGKKYIEDSAVGSFVKGLLGD